MSEFRFEIGEMVAPVAGETYHRLRVKGRAMMETEQGIREIYMIHLFRDAQPIQMFVDESDLREDD